MPRQLVIFARKLENLVTALKTKRSKTETAATEQNAYNMYVVVIKKIRKAQSHRHTLCH